jgi:nucleoid DNA-binding protein
MNTNEMVTAIAQKQELSKAEARRLLDSVVAILKLQLSEGKGFTLPDMGTFEVQEQKERRSYNPHYEQYMMLPPKRSIHFNAGKALKKEIE